MRIHSERTTGGWCSRLLLIVGCLTFAISGCGTTASTTANSSATAVHQVDLSWSAPDSSPVEIVGYNIYRSAPDNSLVQLLNSSVETRTIYVDNGSKWPVLRILYTKCQCFRGRECSVQYGCRDHSLATISTPNHPFISKLHMSASKPGLQFAVQMLPKQC